MILKRRVLSRIILLVSSLSLFCITPLASQGQTPPGNLRAELESAYQHIRKSLQNETPDDYLASIDITGKEAMFKDFNQRWKDPQVKKSLQEFIFKDLSQTVFLTARQEADRAGYYYRFNEPDGQHVTISLMRFKKVNGAWKAVTNSSDVTIFREATEAQTQASIQKELETNSSLAVVKK